MRSLNLALTITSLALVGCDRPSDFITDKSPFVEVRVQTPPDDKAGVADRARRFAEQRGMKVHYVPDHFEPHEFTVSLTRADLNILAGNVLSGGRTNVSAYAPSAPTAGQRAEVDAYLCEVMRHRCTR